ncbi:hypothetical protein Q9Q99_11155 [Curtobacterium flaccumfaciens]|nr:hypothetical protein Q9Q99_11155 [Curtobacterium flaccumfaciens]
MDEHRPDDCVLTEVTIRRRQPLGDALPIGEDQPLIVGSDERRVAEPGGAGNGPQLLSARQRRPMLPSHRESEHRDRVRSSRTGCDPSEDISGHCGHDRAEHI